MRTCETASFSPTGSAGLGSGASRVARGCTYKAHRHTARHVVVTTSRGVVRTRLLVDASGHDSPVLRAERVEADCDYWWSVFGCIVEHPDGIEPGMRVGDYMVWQTFPEPDLGEAASLESGRPVFEYEILDEHRSFPLLLYLRRDKVSGAVMKQRFEQILRDEPAVAAFGRARIAEYKCGWYPSGGLTQARARKRVAFIGDAGCWTTPCGWGMGFILNNYRAYAASLGRLVALDRLDAADLDGLIDGNLHLRRQIAFNQVMTHFLAYAPADAVDRFVDVFHRLQPGLIERIYTLTIEPPEIAEVLRATVEAIGVREVLRIIPAHGYRGLVRALTLLGGELALSRLGLDPGGGKRRAGRGFDVVRPAGAAGTMGLAIRRLNQAPGRAR